MRDTAHQYTARMNRMATDWSKWEATRRKGLLRFVLLAGVLGWGVSVAALWSLRGTRDGHKPPADDRMAAFVSSSEAAYLRRLADSTSALADIMFAYDTLF